MLIYKYNSYTYYEKEKARNPKLILRVNQFYRKVNHDVITKRSEINGISRIQNVGDIKTTRQHTSTNVST